MAKVQLIENISDYRRLADDKNTRCKIAVITTGGEHKLFTVHGLNYDTYPVYENNQWVRTEKVKSSWYVQNLTKFKEQIAEKIIPVCNKWNFEYYYVGDDMLQLELNPYSDPTYWTQYFTDPNKTALIPFGKYKGQELTEEKVKDDLDYWVFLVYKSDWEPTDSKYKTCLEVISKYPCVESAINREKQLEADKEAERERKAREIAKKRALSGFVGTVGERVSLDLTLTKDFTYYSKYVDDYQRAFILEDEDGNIFLYWNTFSMDLGYDEVNNKDYGYAKPEEGDKINLKATIKAHNENDKYGKNTTLSRIYAYTINDLKRNQYKTKG